MNFYKICAIGGPVYTTNVIANVPDVGRASRATLRKVHGCLMVFAWLGCATIAIVTARYYKHPWPAAHVFGSPIWYQARFSATFALAARYHLAAFSYIAASIYSALLRRWPPPCAYSWPRVGWWTISTRSSASSRSCWESCNRSTRSSAAIRTRRAGRYSTGCIERAA